MRHKIALITSRIILLLALLPSAWAHTPPKEAKVFFIGLENGAVIHNPVSLTFGITGFGITAAGTKSKVRHTAGHHHLLIDVADLPDLEQAIPQGKNYLHFDQGETETVLTLSPGQHTLQLLLGDEDHEPQDPPLYSDKITVTVL